MGHRHICLAALLAFWLASVVARGEVVRYQLSATQDDARDVYPVKLLQLALVKSRNSYQLQPAAQPMLQGRALADLEAGKEVDVAWAMTTKAYEANLLPVRIPIFKGLIGWRIPLVPASLPHLFKHVNNLTQLQQLTAGQGHDWPDTAILRANGLPVEGVVRYDSLFQMLAQKRFDYFPRSVVEIWAEAEAHGKDGLVVDPHVAIHYPAAFYFFVNKHNTALADAIRYGLEAAIADGSFDQLFNQYFRTALDRAALVQRTVIELHNPYLPDETPLKRRELWLQPSDLKRAEPHSPGE
jgi:hypothetical protein